MAVKKKVKKAGTRADMCPWEICQVGISPGDPDPIAPTSGSLTCNFRAPDKSRLVMLVDGTIVHQRTVGPDCSLSNGIQHNYTIKPPATAEFRLYDSNNNLRATATYYYTKREPSKKPKSKTVVKKKKT